MSTDKFFEAAMRLRNWSDTLRRKIRNDLPQAEDVVYGRREPLVSPYPKVSAELCLRGIQGPIDEVMSAYDKLYQLLGYTSPCRVYFAYHEAPEAVRKLVWSLLSPFGQSDGDREADSQA